MARASNSIATSPSPATTFPSSELPSGPSAWRLAPLQPAAKHWLSIPTFPARSIAIPKNPPNTIEWVTTSVDELASILCYIPNERLAVGRGPEEATELGCIASHSYITHGPMDIFKCLIEPSITDIDLFRVFAQRNLD
ncbi:hypothetical protein V8F33_002619 [Rhypophila sp. PSN 637]